MNNEAALDVKTSTRLSRSILPAALMLLMWGSFAAVSKLSLAEVDHYEMVFYMFAAAFVASTAVMAVTGRMREVFAVSRRDLMFSILCAVPSFLYYFLYGMSLERIPVLEASMLNYLFPAMVVLFAIPINGERWDRYKLISLAFGFVGMLVILTNGNLLSLKLTNLAGDLLAVGAAASWGIFSNLGRKNKLAGDISNYLYIVVSLVLAFAGMLLFSSFELPSIGALSGLMWVGISNIVISYPLWFSLLRNSSTLFAAGVSFVTPFVNLVFVMLLLGETISPMQIVGLVIIAGSIAIPALGKGK